MLVDPTETNVTTGKFITFEGGEGAGKSTHIKLLQKKLTAEGASVLVTREPGGSPRAEAIRELLLSGKVKPLGPTAEALLFYVARDSHLELTIRPALRDGRIVLSDRFSDSTRAYQGAGGSVSISMLDALEHTIVGPTRPNLTFILDVPPEIGLERARERAQKSGASADRFETMDLSFHKDLRKAFLEIAEAEPDRCVVIDATQPEEAAANQIWEVVIARFGI